ncbi:RNA-directed DNA polymerase, eukaryota, reverse transcriptase zinc-binding domain protein [Tanacetum coccineum]
MINRYQLQNVEIKDDDKEIGEKLARVSDSEKEELNDNCDSMEKEIENQGTCDDNHDVQQCSSINVSLNNMTNDKSISDRNDEHNCSSLYDNDKTSKVTRDRNVEVKSYVEKLLNNKETVDNKLCHIPTVINESGQEFVIFDEELVKEGSKKWELSACGYFVGYRMSMQELSYHLYRMWGKFGLKHILNNGNGIFAFKFNNAQGLQAVIESGPYC